jgi:type IV secretory pathway VirB3-like protein
LVQFPLAMFDTSLKGPERVISRAEIIFGFLFKAFVLVVGFLVKVFVLVVGFLVKVLVLVLVVGIRFKTSAFHSSDLTA